MEPADIENDENKEDQDVTGAATSSEVPADVTAKKSELGDNTSIHSRENEEAEKKGIKSQKKSPERDEEDMESQILMILMNKWMMLEAEKPNTFLSNP